MKSTNRKPKGRYWSICSPTTVQERKNFWMSVKNGKKHAILSLYASEQKPFIWFRKERILRYGVKTKSGIWKSTGIMIRSMYTDKDKTGRIFIMEITPEEAKNIASLLFEFEHLINRYSALPERERAWMALVSAKLRFQLIDILK